MRDENFRKKFLTADYKNGLIRCPVVTTNEPIGRLLFQFLPLMHDFTYSPRWLDYIHSLPANERAEKILNLRKLQAEAMT